MELRAVDAFSGADTVEVGAMPPKLVMEQ